MTQLQFRPRRRVGHFNVSLFLKNDGGKTSYQPLIEGQKENQLNSETCVKSAVRTPKTF